MRTCDTVVHSRILLTQNERREILRGHSLAVDAGKIEAIAPRGKIMAEFAPQREIEGGLVLPGLINAHAHAAMTFARGLGDDMPLMDWLNTRIFPLEARLTPDITRLFSLLGHAEMLSRGVTACMDMYIFEENVFEAAKISGIRLVGGEAVFAFPSAACGNYSTALFETRRLHEKLQGEGRLRCALNPHSVYTTGREILCACRDLAAELDVPLHIHLSETADENSLSLQKNGLRPVALCDELGLLDLPLTAAHAVHVNRDEMALLAKKHVRIAHNPSSNMKLASGIAPVREMLAKGVAVGLGTDGPASNNQLNIFSEMNRAALLHKVAGGGPTALPAQTALDMATIHGAACLHWPELGRLAPGAPADLLSLDLSSPNLLPMHDPVSQAVYAASGHECELTMVAGEVLYQNGKFRRFNLADLMDEIDERLAFVQKMA